jgi:AcrR family transcriptional regulator
MNKRRYEGKQTKKDIVAKAKILFSQKGYTATSMNDICSATGRSIGNIYYHFKSKEDLFIYMAEQVLTEWLEQWEEISVQYKSATEKLYAFANYFVDTNYDRSLNKAGEELINKVGADSEITKKLLAIFSNLFWSFEKLVLEGISKGEFKNENPKELALIILSYHIGLIGNYYFIDKEAMKTLCRKATMLFLEGLSNQEET